MLCNIGCLNLLSDMFFQTSVGMAEVRRVNNLSPYLDARPVRHQQAPSLSLSRRIYFERHNTADFSLPRTFQVNRPSMRTVPVVST